MRGTVHSGGKGKRRLQAALTAFLATIAIPLVEAKRPTPPEPDPEKGTLSVTVSHPSFLMRGITRTHPELNVVAKIKEVYFARLEEATARYRANLVVVSNWGSGVNWHLLNARPGRWVVVGLRVDQSPRENITPSSETAARQLALPYSVFFSEELIRQTMVTVEPGRMTFMGDISYKVGESLVDTWGRPRDEFKESIQWHYFSRVHPDAARAAETGGVLERPTEWAIRTAKREGVAWDTKSARAFWNGAAKKLFNKEPSWLKLVQREADALDETP